MLSLHSETNFMEKCGIVHCVTPWGRWWQTLSEIHIEINVPEETASKFIKIEAKPCYITVEVSGMTVFSKLSLSVV